MTSPSTVLVVDDDVEVANDHARILRAIGYTPISETIPEEVELRLRRNPEIDLVLLDIQMPRQNGIELLERIKVCRPEVGVIMATVVNDVEEAVRAIRGGAYNYLLKPLQRPQVERVLHSYFSNQPAPVIADLRFRSFITGQAEFREIFRRVQAFAEAEVPVLLLGETGTGKELVARLVHALSPRKDRRFLPVNVAALPGSLFESELFGHVRGAFTGALQDRAGYFEKAGDGTLFLDEIGELGPEQQAKLLRVLERRTYSRVGETEEREAGARIVLATNRDLRGDLAAGAFRKDLFFRISNHAISLPPLRERGDDIELLATYFVRKYSSQFGRPLQGLSPKALDLLRTYAFPENIRELEGMISAAVLLEETGLIRPESLPEALRARREEVPELERTRCETIRKVLSECQGNQTRAARRLGIARQTLNRVLKDYRERGWMS
jgi:DNA-binding NtrC family response regulator